MFWNSVWAGLGVLTYWETYAAALVYCATYPIPVAVRGVGTTLKNKAARRLIGYLRIIILPLIVMVAIPVFFLTLSPIILGIGEDAAWAGAWRVIFEAPSAFFELLAGVLLLVVGITLIFPPPQVFWFFGIYACYLVLGGIVLVFAFVHPIMLFNSANFGDVVEHVDLLPKFWFIVGFLVVGGGIAGLISLLVAMFAQTPLEVFPVPESIGQIIIFLTVPMLFFVPVFIYGAWLGSQIPR